MLMQDAHLCSRVFQIGKKESWMREKNIVKKYHLQSGFDVPKTNSILYPLSDYIYWLLHHTLSHPIVSDFMSV